MSFLEIVCVYVHIIYTYVCTHKKRNMYREQNYLMGRTININ